MFRSFGNKILEQLSPTKHSSNISSNNKSLINMFIQNLNAFSEINTDDPLKEQIFYDLVSHFRITFRNSKNESLIEDEDINKCLISFLKFCTEYGSIFFRNDQKDPELLFNTIEFAASLYNDFEMVQKKVDFFPFFVLIVHEIKKNYSLLEKCFSFFTILFKSYDFSMNFLMNDGILLVYSLFFIYDIPSNTNDDFINSYNEEESYALQNSFIHLIFKTVPIEAFLNVSFNKVTSFKILLDYILPTIGYMKKLIEQEMPDYLYQIPSMKNATLFITLYLTLFRKNCPTLIDLFHSFDGFNYMNFLFQYNCLDIAYTCYEILLIETDINKIIVSNLANLYQSRETTSELRTSLIPLLTIQAKSISEMYNAIISVTTLDSFLLPPPFLSKEGYKTLAKVFQTYIDHKIINVQIVLRSILDVLLYPLGNHHKEDQKEIPVYSFVEILIKAYDAKALSAEILINEKFLPDFLFDPKPEILAKYLDFNDSILDIYYLIYISPESEDFRFLIAQKIIIVSDYMSDQQKIANFLNSLVEYKFSSKLCKLLLSYLNKHYIFTELINIMKSKIDYFNFFVESNGFGHLDDYISQNNNISYISIIELLSSLSYFSPHNEIDIWINKQPIESPIFNFPKDYLSKISGGINQNELKQPLDSDFKIFRIPSFLPFCSSFDFRLEFNLYLAGKYGVPACIKRGINIDNIPHIEMICNRYINHNIIKDLISFQKIKIIDFINIEQPQFSLYEMLPSLSKNPTYMIFEYTKFISSISFWFKVYPLSKHQKAEKHNGNIILMSSPLLSIEISQFYDSLIFKTSTDIIPIKNSSYNFQTTCKWHHIVINFHSKKNICDKCEIIVDKNIFSSFIKVENHILPKFICFGSQSPLLYQESILIQIAKSVIFLDTLLSDDQINQINKNGPANTAFKIGSSYCTPYVYDVHYLGFASYFNSSQSIENLFEQLELINSLDSLKKLYLILLNLNSLHNIGFKSFWYRVILLLKRQRKLIHHNLQFFILNKLLQNKLSKAVNLFLSDPEIYFVFNEESIINLFDTIQSSSTSSYSNNKSFINSEIDWAYLESHKLINSLFIILRSGITERIMNSITLFMNKLLKTGQTSYKLRAFLNSSISLCDFDYKNKNTSYISGSSMIREPMKNFNEKVQLNLLKVFVESAKFFSEIILDSGQLLDIIMIFIDNPSKALILIDLLVYYSHNDPKYFKPKCLLLNFIFSKLSKNKTIWKYAFLILSGAIAKIHLDQLLKHFNPDNKSLNNIQNQDQFVSQIKRPFFIPVIIDMLSTLAGFCSNQILLFQNDGDATYWTKEQNLFKKCLSIFMSFENVYSHILKQNCLPNLFHLLFLGILPKKSIGNVKGVRIENEILSDNLLAYKFSNPSKSDCKNIESLITKSDVFSSKIPDSYLSFYDVKIQKFNDILVIKENFPDNVENCQQLINFSLDSNLIDFFVNLVLENFQDIFFESILNGTAFMYIDYWLLFNQSFIITILLRLLTLALNTESEGLLNDQLFSYFKTVFFSAHNKILKGMFSSHNYIKLIEIVFLNFKQRRLFELFLLDERNIKIYREFLLLSFCFVNATDHNKIFKLFLEHKEFVFLPLLFNDNYFSMLWLHLNHNYDKSNEFFIQCMALSMNLIPKEIVSSYSPTTCEEEWNSLKKSSNFGFFVHFSNNSPQYRKNKKRNLNCPPTLTINRSQKIILLKSNRFPIQSKRRNSFSNDLHNNSLQHYHDSFNLRRDSNADLSKPQVEQSYNNNLIIFEKYDINLKISKTESIIENLCNLYDEYKKHEFLSQILRITNYCMEKNLTFFGINAKQRQNEKMMFSFIQLNRLKKFEFKSYHLSPLSYPIYQSRALSPSPFEINSPNSESKIPDFFSIKYTKRNQRIKAIEMFGLLNCSPEWCLFYEKNRNKYGENDIFTSVFEYSELIELGSTPLLKLFEESFNEYGKISCHFDISFLYYIHHIPSVLFVTETHLLTLVLAKGSLQLLSQPNYPIIFLPFTEAVSLGEFSDCSLFCGHVVIITQIEKILSVKPHSYLHKNIGMLISTLGMSDLILIFNNQNEFILFDKFLNSKLQKKIYSPFHHLFAIDSVQSSTILWNNNIISNFEYLLVLNSFGGRSFMDLSQYPVVPWISNPELPPFFDDLNVGTEDFQTIKENNDALEEFHENLDLDSNSKPPSKACHLMSKLLRNLSLPMGQLSKKRAKHFEQTFELSEPVKYYYGFHYSLPGAVFWLLMRVPPYTFFQWDLNDGWDNSQRLFSSIVDAYTSASSSNQADLKELIPAMYQLPESLINLSKIKLNISENVSLPQWANSNPNFFIESQMKLLNDSRELQKWIDLIFGYKQNGENAQKYKNLFLPTSYLNYTNEDLDMDIDSFNSQVLNFGQCPNQLFTKIHPFKLNRKVSQLKTVNLCNSTITCNSILINSGIEILNPSLLDKYTIMLINEKYIALPPASIPYPLKCSGQYFFLKIDQEHESISLINIQTMQAAFTKFSFDFAYIRHATISEDGLFIAITFSFGRVDIFQIVFDENNNGEPCNIVKFGSFLYYHSCMISSLLPQDYLCATAFKCKKKYNFKKKFLIIIWNFATGMIHRKLKIDFKPIQILFDSFNAVLSIAGKKQIIQYSINAVKLRAFYTNTKYKITCMNYIFIDLAFDKRFIIIGQDNGDISILSVNPSSFDFQILFTKNVHNNPITSIFPQKTLLKVLSIDSKCIAYLTDFTELIDMDSVVIRCNFCDNPQTCTCKICHLPICNGCKNNRHNTCPLCKP